MAIHIPKTGQLAAKNATKSKPSAKSAGYASLMMQNAWSETTRRDGKVRERVHLAENDLLLLADWAVKRRRCRSSPCCRLAANCVCI